MNTLVSIKRSILGLSVTWLPAAALALLPNPAHAMTISASIPNAKNLFGNLNQADTICPTTSCGPTAATNSLVYLQRRFPHIYDNKLVPMQNQDLDGDGDVDFYDDMIATANDIGLNFMKTCDVCGNGTGTYIEDFIIGKRDYIESKVPGRTKYGAQISIKWRTTAAEFPQPQPPEVPGTHLGTGKPDFVQDMMPATLAYLASEIKKGEDVELFVGNGTAHYLTLTGITFDDQTNMGMFSFIDPLNQTRGTSGMATISTANILGLDANGVIETDYSGGSFLYHAVSESPIIPEPSSVLGLLAFGILGSGAALKRNQKQNSTEK